MGVGLAVACEGLSGLDRGLRVSSGFWFRVDNCVCVCLCVCGLYPTSEVLHQGLISRHFGGADKRAP